jgi:hypothetical protein
MVEIARQSLPRTFDDIAADFIISNVAQLRSQDKRLLHRRERAGCKLRTIASKNSKAE